MSTGDTIYDLFITAKAEKDIRKLPALVRTRVIEHVNALATDPRPYGSIKLTNSDGIHRVRVNDYRVLYVIDDGRTYIEVRRVKHRSEAYD